MKSRNALLGLSLLLAMPLAAVDKFYVSEVWVGDLGIGKYKKPLLYTDFSLFLINGFNRSGTEELCICSMGFRPRKR